MNMTKFVLDRRDPSVRQGLMNCHDMHRSIMRVFGGDDAREQAGVLYRIIEKDAEIELYVFSARPPEAQARGMRCVGTRTIDEIKDMLKPGNRYRFDLLASPTKKVFGEGKNSKRVYLGRAEDRSAWLHRKAEQYGFAVDFLDEQAEQTVSGRKAGMYVTNRAVRFVGVLRVTDPERFWRAYQTGIGPGKAYGMGMLLIRGL